MNRVPAQVVLDVIKTGGLKLVVEFFIERWFGYIECTFPTKPGFLKVRGPVETGGERLQLRQVNFVVKIVWLAALDTGYGSLGQCRLNSHDRDRFALCRV